MRLLVVLLSVAILSGCLQGADLGHHDDPPALGVAPFETLPAVAACPAACWETTVAIDPQGRIFVASGDGNLVVSHDGGGTFEGLAPPPVPGLAGSEGLDWGGDEQVDVGRDGRLYFSALRRVGIQVAASSDGGKTWEQNVLVQTGAGGSGHTVYADRQWLAFGDERTVYLAFQRPVYVPGGLGSSELVVGRSDDGGRTFGPLRSLTPQPGFMGGIIVGQPVAAPDGTLYLPHFYYPQDGESQLRLAVSQDRAETFTFHKIPSPGPFPGAWFAVPAVAPNGTLYVTWRNGGQQVMLSGSVDGGMTWGPATTMMPDEMPGTASPWLVVDPDGIPHVAHFVEESPRTTRLLLSSLVAGRVHHIELATGIQGTPTIAANTHMAHMALDRDGRPVPVWSDAGTRQAWIARAHATTWPLWLATPPVPEAQPPPPEGVLDGPVVYEFTGHLAVSYYCYADNPVVENVIYDFTAADHFFEVPPGARFLNATLSWDIGDMPDWRLDDLELELFDARGRFRNGSWFEKPERVNIELEADDAGEWRAWVYVCSSLPTDYALKIEVR